jgi:hypothetical protein
LTETVISGGIGAGCGSSSRAGGGGPEVSAHRDIRTYAAPDLRRRPGTPTRSPLGPAERAKKKGRARQTKLGAGPQPSRAGPDAFGLIATHTSEPHPAPEAGRLDPGPTTPERPRSAVTNPLRYF